jgi:hypothetical protein
MNLIPCYTSLAIHTDIHSEKIDAAKKFMKETYGSTFDVDPHVTHLLFPMLNENFEELLPHLEVYLTALSPMTVHLGDVEVEERRKFFKLGIHDSNLDSLHRDLLEIAAPFRRGAMRQKDIERLDNDYYDEKHKKYLNKYGYPRVLDMNKPHITLGSCETDICDLVKIKAELLDILEGVANSDLVISEIGIMLHTDAKVQSDMEVLYFKNYILK